MVTASQLIPNEGRFMIHLRNKTGMFSPLLFCSEVSAYMLIVCSNTDDRDKWVIYSETHLQHNHADTSTALIYTPQQGKGGCFYPENHCIPHFDVQESLDYVASLSIKREAWLTARSRFRTVGSILSSTTLHHHYSKSVSAFIFLSPRFHDKHSYEDTN